LKNKLSCSFLFLTKKSKILNGNWSFIENDLSDSLRIHSLFGTEFGNSDEPFIVAAAEVSATAGALGLVLFGDFGSLIADFTGVR
jgi:hypothetical protein